MRVPSFAFNLTCIELFYVPRFLKFSLNRTHFELIDFERLETSSWPHLTPSHDQRLLIEPIGWTLSFHNYDFKRCSHFQNHQKSLNFKPQTDWSLFLMEFWIDIIWYYMKSYDFLAWRGLSYLIKLGLITKYIYPICQPLPLPLNYVSLSL